MDTMKSNEPAPAGTGTSSEVSKDTNNTVNNDTPKSRLCQAFTLKKPRKYQVACKKQAFYPITLSERAQMQKIADIMVSLVQACGYTDITNIQFTGKTKYRFAVNCIDRIRYVVPITKLDRMTAVINTLETIQENERRLWNEY